MSEALAIGRRRRRARLGGRRARGPVRRLGVAQTRELRLIEARHDVTLCPQASAAPGNPGDRPLCAWQERRRGLAKVHKLSSNKSPLGPSPKAIEAVRALADSLELYPDGASTALREAIGRRYGLDPARIICGNGSDELLALLAHVFLHPGDEGLYSQYGFLTYPICIRAAGGVPVVANETDRTASVDAHSGEDQRSDEDRLSRQSEQPDRNLPAVLRGQAPARRPADAHAARDRRGLRRICDPQRLRRRASSLPRPATMSS